MTYHFIPVAAARAFAASAVVLVAAGALAAASRQAPAPAIAAGPAWSKVVAFYHDRLQQAGIVGSSLVLVRGGAVAAEQVEGYQDLDAKRPTDRDTIYHWASITKTFTGIAIMQLRDRGLLALDDPAVKYVPELRAVHNPFGDMSQVTIRQLMSHTASGRRRGPGAATSRGTRSNRRAGSRWSRCSRTPNCSSNRARNTATQTQALSSSGASSKR
jgi:CubicO group peptidase (beta-lactamase class C family)